MDFYGLSLRPSVVKGILHDNLPRAIIISLGKCQNVFDFKRSPLTMFSLSFFSDFFNMAQPTWYVFQGDQAELMMPCL